MSNQLQVASGANILGGLTVVGGINADSVNVNGTPVGSANVSLPVSGDGSVGNPLTIAAGALTNTSLANMAAATVKGSISGGVPVDLTGTQLTALLNLGSGLALSTGSLTATLTTGLSGGQTVIGDTAASGNLILESTSNATKGKIGLGGTTNYYSELNSAFYLASGTSTTPTYSFSASTNSGFYYSSSDAAVELVVQGQHVWFTNATGNMVLVNAACGIYFGSAFLEAIVRSGAGSGLLTFQTNGANRLQIANNGTVSAQSVRIEEAKGANVASATTVTLGNDGNYFLITGTTTIAGLVTTGFQAGSRICLELPSGITITNNSGTPGASAVAILLRAGSNLTTSGAYYLELYYNGTNWVQPS